jgi:hypothetical protein
VDDLAQKFFLICACLDAIWQGPGGAAPEAYAW